MEMNKINLKKKILFVSLPVILLIAVIGTILLNNTIEKMSYNDFLHNVDNGYVEEIKFFPEGNTFTVFLRNDEASYEVYNPKSDDFIEYLLRNNVTITYTTGSTSQTVSRTIIFLTMALAVILFGISKKKNELIKDNSNNNDSDIAVTLSDIAGNVEAKYMVWDIIKFIKEPEQYTKLGAKMPRGILFYGPPGTGKTLMAKAIAGEASVPFYAMSGSDFIQMYVGVGASRIRELFKKAKKTEKAVIFIDEIDAIGKKRGKSPNSSNDERDQTLNALLTEMSGFHERSGVVVIAATNRLDTLDEALTRPGRFDRLIEIGLPDINARKKILLLHAKSKPIADEVNLDELARSTVSFSGAMLEHLLNEAAILAANESCEYIGTRHIDKAYYTVIAGAQKSDTSYISNEERKVTAFHEAGHAYMTKLVLPDSYISKVTIIPSVQGAGGFSLSIPKDSLYMTKQGILANMKVLLAGRAAEELAFGKENITTGASNDIEKVSKIMLDYINKYGMDEEFGIFNSLSIDSYNINHLLDICRDKVNLLYEQTLHELQQNFNILSMIANTLLEKETLNGYDIEELCKSA